MITCVDFRPLAQAAAACAILFWTPASATADEMGFQAAQTDAYAHYREAVFYARTGNVAVAGLALDDFVAKWGTLAERYAEDPPPEYHGDAAWAATLHDVLERAEAGLQALDVGDAEAAHDAIQPIRGILGGLRRRNNVVGYSDLVDELSAAMDVLARYRREVKELDDPSTIAMVRKQANMVAASFERCRIEATPEIADNPEFTRLIEGAAESMGKLLRSLETKNMRLYRIGIGELRSYERIMYLRFG